MPRPRLDLTGQKFGKLTAIKFAYVNQRHVFWLCKCECGKETNVPVNALRAKKWSTKSCGCALGCYEHKKKIRKNPESVITFLTRIKSWYNIYPKDWTNLVLRSNGRCELCSKQFVNASYDLNIDHDHITGKVRGLLCSKCNKNLFIVEDQIFCAKAIVYLELSKNFDGPVVPFSLK